MARRTVRSATTLGAGAIVSGIVLTILVVLAPSCSDIAGEPRSILCVGGMGEPAWKTPALVAVYVLLVPASTVAMRRFVGD
jgi:hypothetical protein